MTAKSKDLGKKCLHFNYESVISDRFVRSQLGLHSKQPHTLCMTEHEWGSADCRGLLKEGSKASTAHMAVYIIFPEWHLQGCVSHDWTVWYIHLWGVSLKGRKYDSKMLQKISGSTGSYPTTWRGLRSREMSYPPPRTCLEAQLCTSVQNKSILNRQMKISESFM